MAAWKSTGRIGQHREKLITGMMVKGIEQEFAERIFEQIKGFGEYGFPESHAASFALIAYATAYLKCHHPDVFACALLNAWPMGFYSPASILADAKRHNVPLLAADLLHSDWDCTLEQKVGWPNFALRVGLRYIKGLARGEAEQLLQFRHQGRGRPLQAWKAACRVASDTWEKLAVSGALQSFGIHRRDALWTVLDQVAPDPLELSVAEPRGFEAPGAGESVTWDYATMGHSAQAHILQQFRSQLRKEQFLTAAEVATLQSPRRARHAGLVICRQRPSTANGVLFLTLEDESGIVNVVVWTKVWERFRKVILTSVFLAVEGKIQAEEGVVHVVADRFWCPESLLESHGLRPQSHDFH